MVQLKSNVCSNLLLHVLVTTPRDVLAMNHRNSPRLTKIFVKLIPRLLFIIFQRYGPSGQNENKDVPEKLCVRRQNVLTVFTNDY